MVKKKIMDSRPKNKKPLTSEKKENLGKALLTIPALAKQAPGVLFLKKKNGNPKPKQTRTKTEISESKDRDRTTLMASKEKIECRSHLMDLIERKYEGAQLKEYRFPGRASPPQSLDDEQSLLDSLKEAGVYDLNAQNRRRDSTKPLKKMVPIDLSKVVSTERKAKCKNDPKHFSQRSKLNTDRVLVKESSSKNLFLKKGLFLKEFMKGLKARKDVTKETCVDTTFKGTTKISSNTKSGDVLRKSRDLKNFSSERLKKDLVLRYLKKARVSMDKCKKIGDMGRSPPKGYQSQRGQHTMERIGSENVKSFSQLFRNREESSVEKYKRLRLTIVGQEKGGSESRFKNSKSFHFANNTHLVNQVSKGWPEETGRAVRNAQVCGAVALRQKEGKMGGSTLKKRNPRSLIKKRPADVSEKGSIDKYAYLDRNTFYDVSKY
jgi:hypothetical protein